MKPAHRDQCVIVGTLLVISISIGCLPTAKKSELEMLTTRQKSKPIVSLPPLPKPPVPTTFIKAPPLQYGSGLIGLGAASLLASVRLLVESQSVELLVEQLQGITLKSAQEFLAELIIQPRSMDADEVIQVAYGLLMYFIHDKAHAQKIYQILDLINTARELKDHPPLLVIAARSSYPRVISLLLAWAKQRAILDRILQDGLIFAAKTLDLRMLKTMQANGVELTPELATLMLWHAVQVVTQPSEQDDDDRIQYRKAGADFIAFLITKKADINYDRDGYTILMKATQNNDAATIEQLIQAGAEVDRIVKDEIGSALQLAMVNDTIDAELMLRRYNAHE